MKIGVKGVLKHNKRQDVAKFNRRNYCFKIYIQ